MARRAAFWFFLVLLAVGFGWAANEQWRLPFPGLFNWQADQQEALPEPEAGLDAEPGGEPGTEPPVDSVVAAIPEPTVPGPAVSEPMVAEPAGTEPAGTPALSEPPSQRPGTAVAAVEPTDPPASETDVAPPAGDAAPGAALESAHEPAPPSTAATSQAETGQASSPAPASGRADAASGSDSGAQDTAQQNIAAQQGIAATPEQPLPGGQVTIRPTFDIVRVERDGRAVIAGRAEPGAEVVVRSGEQVIDRVRASRRGEWVAIPTRPLSPGDQQLSAVARRDGAPAIRSEQVVVIAVPEPVRPQPATPQPAAGQVAAAEPPVAVLLPRDGKGPGRILQAPGRLSAEDTLALMTVSYDESGKVLLSGEAPPGVPVRIYVDNRPAALVVGDVKGAWASGLDDTLAPGTYTLRLDQLDAQGQPVARIETPFTRVSDPPIEGQLQVDYVVVQPGNSLWRIARRLSGEGLDYLHIYDTNQSQIRDPDLIYPGQVFEIPVEVGSAG